MTTTRTEKRKMEKGRALLFVFCVHFLVFVLIIPINHNKKEKREKEKNEGKRREKKGKRGKKRGPEGSSSSSIQQMPLTTVKKNKSTTNSCFW